MIYQGKAFETEAVERVAQQMCVAARTAPKTKGKDYTASAVVTGDDLFALADEMERLSETSGMAFLKRDAGNVRVSAAVVLIGCKNAPHALNGLCGFCGFENCASCTQEGGACAFTGIDLGIAIGSAVSVAKDACVDNRVMFSVGVAAKALGWLQGDCDQVIGISLSVSGKSPFFDRKPN